MLPIYHKIFILWAVMKKLILHIGQSKTGTTSLQAFLRDNSRALIQQGILYPDYYRVGMPLGILNHNSLADALSGLSRYPHFSLHEYSEQFQKEMTKENCHTMILSGESFFGSPQIWRLDEGQKFLDAHRTKLERLKPFIQDFETHIIAYMRSPEDWLESAIAHIIRYEGLIGHKIYENDRQLFELLKPHLDYPEILTLWQEIINPAKMTILPYDRSRLINQDIVSDFMGRIGIDPSTVSSKPSASEENKSLDRRYIAVKKWLNKHKRSKTSERAIIECLDYLNNKLHKPQKYSLNRELHKDLESYCRPCREWMTRHYSTDDEDFFKPYSVEIIEPLKESEIIEAWESFERLYYSMSMRWSRAKIASKGFLRNRMPRLYTVIKNIAATVKPLLPSQKSQTNSEIKS